MAIPNDTCLYRSQLNSQFSTLYSKTVNTEKSKEKSRDLPRHRSFFMISVNSVFRRVQAKKSLKITRCNVISDYQLHL